jgi:hypothetical protein
MRLIQMLLPLDDMPPVLREVNEIIDAIRATKKTKVKKSIYRGGVR